ncbi:protein serine threonine phosphatase : Protein serine/threonine phosphatase OS=Rhodopirellula europaea 6C GN=RE6C_02710 PE=4 SV=1: HAMP: SpoIIE [Gemmataceae bacterium]|nr:protein serine threonine phosphatase : Protein serine/threonine phosphatase OS=Rhodopirellula europaea 6C GN=RE6C_02710 PE=4 SV=1: HAMP: SpoIIE [Gemmataceae bacterium]VTU01673.1 protein serine threonine phosphatase : Protein serine/threonine phosphatase OS=Rhodopirellula europaea 6C GN=RE6C_02710 PE=4 SV=1: HAMP: SpoIIE [Gemmataceae bacterium]
MPSSTPSRPVRLRGIGFRTSVAVNLVVFLAVAGFIAFDAVRETREHVVERTAALDEEAMTIHRAVVRPAAELGEVQQFIDGVCLRMSDTTSPGHHIVVESGGRVYQSRPHRRESDEIVSAIRAAASDSERQATLGDVGIVTGVHAEDGVIVYVAEQLDDIRREVRGRVVTRSVGVLVFGVLLAVSVHLLVHRLVSRPLRRLVRTIEAIRAGKLGAQTGPFRTDELDRLAGAVNDMSRALANDADRRRLALEQARRVQENLLPRSGEVAPGVRLAATHRPAEAVAGDYYDVLALPDGTVVCCVADVVGHGVPAAMVAAILKVLILDAVEVDADPGAVVRRVNARFAAVAPPECFASLLVTRWCPVRQTLWHASAGHEPGFLLTDAPTALLLPATGTLLGVMPDGTWDTEAAPAPPGSVLVGLSDGVTEAMDAGGNLFGRDRVGEAVRSVGRASPEEIVGAVDRAVLRHLGGSQPADDYTLMAVRFGRDPSEHETQE